MRSDDDVTTLPREQRENIDRLLVCGELQAEGGRRWPSIRDLATKYGISISVIATQSTKYGCQLRRKAFERYTTYNTPQFGELRGKDRTDWIKAQCAPPKVSPSATFRPTFPEAPAHPNEKHGIPRSPPPPPRLTHANTRRSSSSMTQTRNRTIETRKNSSRNEGGRFTRRLFAKRLAIAGMKRQSFRGMRLTDCS